MLCIHINTSFSCDEFEPFFHKIALFMLKCWQEKWALYKRNWSRFLWCIWNWRVTSVIINFSAFYRWLYAK